MRENEVGKFLRLLTHDLQNQLGAVDLNLQVIPSVVDESTPTYKTIHPFILRAEQASHDMIESLIDVQAFARLVSQKDEAGEDLASPELIEIDLSSKVFDCVMILASTAKSRDLIVKSGSKERVLSRGVSDDVRRALKIVATELLRTSFPGSEISVEALMDQGVPVVELGSTQEGLLDPNRQTLALFLAGELLKHSSASFDFVSAADLAGPSRLRIRFQPA